MTLQKRWGQWKPTSITPNEVRNLIKSKIYEFQVAPRADSFLPGFAFGLLGQLADASINEQSGLFQISIQRYDDKWLLMLVTKKDENV